MSSNSYLHAFGTRMQNIGMFYPLFELRNLRKYDFPTDSLGVAILLFILERMLHGSKGVTIEEISDEFYDYVNRTFQKSYTEQEFRQIMTEFIHEQLMKKGELHTYRYWDYEKSQFAEQKFALLTHTEIDVQERTSKLKLTHEGLEILFKTKEMLGEIKISIKTLYLRQQIEKGVWDDALGTVRELRGLVREEAERMIELAEKIRKDVLLVHRQHELKSRLQKINDQIKRERRDFIELQDLIKQTKEEHPDQEEIVGRKMAQLERELYDVRVEHESLLDGKLNLQQLMTSNLDSLVMNMFSTKINFETEVLIPMMKQAPTLETMNKLLNPLLPITVHKSFHPGRVFEVQMFRTRQALDEPEEVIEITPEQLRESEKKEREAEEEQVKRLCGFLTLLLLPLAEKDEVELRHILRDQEPDPRFYSLLLELHQMGEIELRRSAELTGMVLEPLPRALIRVVDEHESIYRIGSFEVFSDSSNALEMPGIRGVSNFIFKRGNKKREPL
ncbi:hypothetical protein ABE237_21345 [Brevibacillus formosus]|uniref:hypothetical protein n=1 Tax=Brevibacillus formosus TaxID=54913 RepID=UPI0018CEEDCF|nr:hypothetical protein [Brevibacillus formosus]